MITGTNAAIYIDERIDSDGELEINIEAYECESWLNKEMAIEVIKHLQKVFDIKKGDS